VIRDEFSGSCVTKTKYLIAKYANDSELNQRREAAISYCLGKLKQWQPERMKNPGKIRTTSGK